MKRIVAAVCLSLPVAFATQATLAQQPATPKPSTAVILSLPDSGGYLINNHPIAWTELPEQLEAIFGARPAAARVLVVETPEVGRTDDLKYVEATARQAGVRVEHR